jgi:DNA-binding NarL/FixJ family response regulator
MPVTSQQRKRIIAGLTRGGETNGEIAARAKCSVEDVEGVRGALWKRVRTFDYAKNPNPWAKY